MVRDATGDRVGAGRSRDRPGQRAGGACIGPRRARDDAAVVVGLVPCDQDVPDAEGRADRTGQGGEILRAGQARRGGHDAGEEQRLRRLAVISERRRTGVAIRHVVACCGSWRTFVAHRSGRLLCHVRAGSPTACG